MHRNIFYKFDRARILIEKRYKIIVFVFFVLFLIVGISIFKDYGVGIDEASHRGNGLRSIEYIMEGDQSLFNYDIRYYGPAFEMFLAFIEKIFNLTEDLRAVYLMRHLFTFILFLVSVFFFYKLCKNNFNSWKVGLLGSLFLILSPRIFADSFYNSVDIPFLSLFIISVYTLIQYLNKKTLPRAIAHAIVCAVLIDIRIMGIIIPFFTLIFLIIDIFVKGRKEVNKRIVISSFIIYTFLMISLIILLWPALWRDPLNEFINSFRLLRMYPWQSSSLYLGEYIQGTTPWHYTPVWILISTPILYSVLFLIGIYSTIKIFFKEPIKFYVDKRDNIIFLLWFFLPLITVVVLNSVLYCAWRHMFFIYPSFLIFSLVGVNFIFRSIKKNLKTMSFKVINSIFIVILIFSIFNTAFFMIKYHPHQNVYFNILAGKNMSEAKDSFELDYWGLSYKQALEYILENDKDEIIKVYTTTSPGRPYSDLILRTEEKNRLVFLDETDEAEYFLSNYRLHKEEFTYDNEYYSIKVGDARIMVVYKLR